MNGCDVHFMSPPFLARKRFGQHFLVDQAIIDAIVSAINPQAEQHLVEIGPGRGALTEPVLRRVQHLHAIEIDTDLVAYLRAHIAPLGLLELYSQSALDFDFATLPSPFRLFGNLPYNITSPLLIHLLPYVPMIQDMHFMVQREVAQRITAKSGGRDYGRLTIMLQYHFQIERLFDIAPTAFKPQPKVHSSMIRLKAHKTVLYKCTDVTLLERLVKQAFSQRRKTLKNNLKGMVSAESLEAMGIDGQRRPETLSIAEYVRLSHILSKSKLNSD